MSQNTTRSALPAFQNKSICIGGICTVDALARTVDDYPPPGGLRLFDSLAFSTGGNATNAAIALAKMGFSTDVVLKVGPDSTGDLILSELKKHGIGADGVIRSKAGHTSYTFVAIHADGQRSFFHTRGENATLTREEINIPHICRSDLFFLTGTMLMPALDGPPMVALLEEVQDSGTVTLLDTNYVDSATRQQWRDTILPCLPHVDYFLPSRLEAVAITGEDDTEKQADIFLEEGCHCAIIKLDAEGAFCKDASGATCMIPSYKIDNVVDTTGAGDCWCAGFLAGLATGQPIPEAIRLGNAVAGHCIQHPGASNGIPTLEEIHAFQKANPCGDQ